MSFKSILSDIGHGVLKVLGAAAKGAVAAEPIVDAFFPAAAPLFNLVAVEVGKAEAVAVAAGQQNGTGAQKLQIVVQGIEGMVTQYYQAKGITTPPTAAELEAIANAVVAYLNALPAGPTPATPAPTAAA